MAGKEDEARSPHLLGLKTQNTFQRLATSLALSSLMPEEKSKRRPNSLT